MPLPHRPAQACRWGGPRHCRLQRPSCGLPEPTVRTRGTGSWDRGRHAPARRSGAGTPAHRGRRVLGIRSTSRRKRQVSTKTGQSHNMVATRVASCRFRSSAIGAASSRRRFACSTTRTAAWRSSMARGGWPTMSRTGRCLRRAVRPEPPRNYAPWRLAMDGLDELRSPTPPTAQQQKQKRTFDVLRKPDIFTRYRQPLRLPSWHTGSRVLDATDSRRLGQVSCGSWACRGDECGRSRRCVPADPPRLRVTSHGSPDPKLLCVELLASSRCAQLTFRLSTP